jgi:hypothetical protein
MGFEKGNNLGGRKDGSKNKVTQDIRKAFENLINNNIETMQKDLDALESKDRLRMIIDLSAYVIPKLKQIELEASASVIEDFKPLIINLDGN